MDRQVYVTKERCLFPFHLVSAIDYGLTLQGILHVIEFLTGQKQFS